MYDVAIIGSGIAGLSCALTLAQNNKRVVLITKKHLIASATNYAQGGIAAVLSQLDSVKTHIEDTLIAGAHHNKIEAVKQMAEEGKMAVEWLLECGVPFATLSGELQLTREGGHSMRRIAFVGDYTGKAIEQTLVRRCRKEKNITILTDTFASNLYIKKGICHGVEIGQTGSKKTTLITAEAVVIATGGVGQVYAHTTNPRISTGDGIAMAYRAGAKVRDLEFMQFHPTAFIYKGKTKFLLSEALRGEGAILRNSNAVAFMKNYDTRKELAPRDIVARAIFQEEKTGPVYLDLRHLDYHMVHARFPTLSTLVARYGLDLAQDLIPISPAAHYMCGGIEVTLHGETNIKNLYCFGEAAYTGVHGANRLASNSLLEAVVFARSVSKTLVKTNRAQKIKIHFTSRPLHHLSLKEMKNIHTIQQKLRKIMWNNVGVVRTHAELITASNGIKSLITELAKNKTSILSIETNNMLTVALLITKAARARPTSLGCHYRL